MDSKYFQRNTSVYIFMPPRILNPETFSQRTFINVVVLLSLLLEVTVCMLDCTGLPVCANTGERRKPYATHYVIIPSLSFLSCPLNLLASTSSQNMDIVLLLIIYTRETMSLLSKNPVFVTTQEQSKHLSTLALVSATMMSLDNCLHWSAS